MNAITKRYNNKTILHNIYFKLDKSEKIGLLGRNGSGKTTFFKLLMGIEEADEGMIEIDDGMSFGYFSQFSELRGNERIVDILDGEFARVHEIETELSEIDGKIAECLDEKKTMNYVKKQMKLFAEMDHLDAWNYRYKIETVLSKLQFSETHRNLPVSQLSGGWRNRASLALLLIKNPDIILLDEPTNFLDSEGVKWLADWIKKLPATVIVVSHDRYFLDLATTKMIEIENNKLYEYSGNYSEYVKQKRSRKAELERDFEHEEELLIMEQNEIKDRSTLRKLIDSGDSAYGYLERKMANINRNRPQLNSEKVVTSLYYDLYVPEKTVNVEKISVEYDGREIFENVSFDMAGGERMGIVGPNGCGKTTLINVLTSEMKQSGGRISWGVGRMIYFNRVLDELNGNELVYQNIYTESELNSSRKKVYKFVKLLGFAECDMKEKIGNLSGGQKARVALAKCLLSGCTMIILDEPTNHLDISSIQTIECALLNFPGSIIFVSHDTFFIDKLATRLLAYKDNTFVDFRGNMTMYQNNMAI